MKPSCVAVTEANQTAIRQLLTRLTHSAWQASKPPEDYDPAGGARFEVHLTKARGVFGEDAFAFEAKLELDEEGAARWSAPILRAKTPVPLSTAVPLP